MPNWKYPCCQCKKPVKSNQKGLECDSCKKWVHLKCTDLNESQYEILNDNEDLPFYCLDCKPRLLYADVIFADPMLSPILSVSDDLYSSSSDDYEYVDDSDSDSRGLDFKSLPVKNVNSHKYSRNRLSTSSNKYISLQTRNYRFPCVICLGPCREKA